MVVSALRSMRCCSATLRVPLLSCHKRTNPDHAPSLSSLALHSPSLGSLQSGSAILALRHHQPGAPTRLPQAPRAMAAAPLAPSPPFAQHPRQASTSTSTFYCSPQIDRAGHFRTDVAWLQAAMKADDTLVVPLLECKSLLAQDRAVIPPLKALPAALKEQLASYHWEGPAQGAQLGPGAVEGEVGVGAPLVCFLGVLKETSQAVFAVAFQDPSLLGPLTELHPDAAWADLRREGPNLGAPEAGLLAYARGLVEWHSRTRFCAKCGGALAPGEAGHTRQCTAPAADGSPCATIFHPRIDPAVIMCITCGDFVLLGRQSRWSPGRYSVLAGFVEVGEAFEESVAREVLEEAGVIVKEGSVRYVASQPWPFPCSLMIGFSGEANPASAPGSAPVGGGNGAGVSEPEDELRCGIRKEEREAVLGPLARLPPTLVTAELEDSRWIHRELVRGLVQGNEGGDAAGTPNAAGTQSGIFTPGPYAIAHVLLKDWVARVGGGGGTGAPQGVEGGAWAGEGVPSVEIDEGTFKYVLMRLTETATGRSKLVVRGHKMAAYHLNIFERTRSEVARAGFEVVPLGGGRITHDPEARTITVYGHSQAYGQADHAVSRGLISRLYPLHDIQISDEGY